MDKKMTQLDVDAYRDYLSARDLADAACRALSRATYAADRVSLSVVQDAAYRALAVARARLSASQIAGEC